MSLPLHPSEMRFNCARAETRLSRGRDCLYHLEPASGCFVVWRVLGFGGRPNPLLFARAASFATRTAQALLGSVLPEVRAADAYSMKNAHGMLQTFVDDPALSVRGTWDQAAVSFDLVIAWWLALGIPLSWKKGLFTAATRYTDGSELITPSSTVGPACGSPPTSSLNCWSSLSLYALRLDRFLGAHHRLEGYHPPIVHF